MSWQDLLAPGTHEITVPWISGRKVHSTDRTWKVEGRRPREHGWYVFQVGGGRAAKLVGPADFPPDHWPCDTVTGYVASERFIPDDARVDPDPDKLVEQTEPIYCLERGLARFTRIEAFRDREGRLVYLCTEFPLGPEDEVTFAYQDRMASVTHVKDVTPALDAAFRWEVRERELAEERRREAERRRIEAERRAAEEARVRELAQRLNTGAGRREMAQHDFRRAAEAALAVSGAELLDVIDGGHPGEKCVQYRFRGRRLECVVDLQLRILEAGVCLGHGEHRGDRLFTLESLPGVVGVAIDRGILVVYRHAPGDPDYRRW
jgi:hypothetical protein